jgi:hypothetical protein
MTKQSTIIKQLEERNPLPPLCPKEVWNSKLTREIEEMPGKELTGEDSSQSKYLAVKSALLLWNDDLYPSHTISQNLHNEVGSYLHGIMHRREGDFSNAKYWFSSVGIHPIFSSLYKQASEISSEVKSWGKWDPDRYIDEVERVISSGTELSQEGEVLRQIQVLEISLLLKYTLEG